MLLYTTEAGLSRRENGGARAKGGPWWSWFGRWGAVVWLVTGAGLTGCGVADVAWGYSCDDYVPGRKDALGNPAPCGNNLPADAGPGAVDPDGCTGECLPFGAEGENWTKTPLLRWVGERGKAPDCPQFTFVGTDTYYTDLVSPPKECGTCSCDAPNGSCGLPKKITAHAATCQELYQVPPQTSFDPPEDWDGSCTTAHAIDGGLPCPGGVDCVQSLTFSELEIVDDKCTPVTSPGPEAPEPYWNTEVRICGRHSWETCTDGRVCAPAFPPEFRYCIMEVGEASDDTKCPEDFPDEEIYYAGYDDNRCSPCRCDLPAGSTCSGCIGIYADSTCSMMRECQSVSSYQPQPACTDIMPSGLALLSKQAFNITYTPGACTPHGQEQGAAVATRRRRFCCRAPSVAN